MQREESWKDTNQSHAPPQSGKNLTGDPPQARAQSNMEKIVLVQLIQLQADPNITKFLSF